MSKKALQCIMESTKLNVQKAERESGSFGSSEIRVIGRSVDRTVVAESVAERVLRNDNDVDCPDVESTNY